MSLFRKWQEYLKNREQIRKNLQVYDHKRSNIGKRVEAEYIDHGIATIPCKVSDIDEIISSYSVPGYESLESDFVDYLNGIVDFVPEQYPIVLSIVGKKFTEEEQRAIKSTIESDLAYNLGAVEKESSHLMKMFIIMIIGTILSGMMISVFDWWSALPMETLYIFFWFFAYTIVEYIFLDGRDLKKRRIRAARLSCLQIVFSEEYNECEYSAEEAKEILEGLQNKS